MARPPKQGIDYSAWRVDISENDTKIDALLDAQGWVGFSVYFYLCQKAYSSEGYFYRWSYANAATTARRMGGGIRSEAVRQAVGVCLRIGLFDKRLFDLGGVLTSKGIQRQFCSVVQNRRCKKVNMSYWLLSPQETKSYGITPEKNDPQDDAGIVYPYSDDLQDANEGLQDANEGLQDANGGYDPIEYSKGKERRVKESKGEDSTLDFNPSKGAVDLETYHLENSMKLIESRHFTPKLEFALKDWLKYKADLGYGYRDSGTHALVSMIARKVDQIGEKAVCEAIETSMGQGWKSIVFNTDERRGGSAGGKSQSGKGGGYDYETIRGYLDD